MSLERFKTAQASPDSGFETALTELRGGRKTSHWIWYVFPQLASLGRSDTAKFYGLHGVTEARDYLRDPVLRKRLLLISETVAAKLGEGIAISTLMGGAGDSQKLVSSLTLFEIAANGPGANASDPELKQLAALCRQILATAEAQGMARCATTLAEGAASESS